MKEGFSVKEEGVGGRVVVVPIERRGVRGVVGRRERIWDCGWVGCWWMYCLGGEVRVGMAIGIGIGMEREKGEGNGGSERTMCGFDGRVERERVDWHVESDNGDATAVAVDANNEERGDARKSVVVHMVG